MRRLALFALVACRSAPAKQPEPVPVPEPGPALPALYAGMFVDGATFRYTVTRIQEEPDDDATTPDRSEDKSEVTCRVTAVERTAAATTSTIECDGDAFDGVAGTWTADARGLAFDDGADVLISAHPTAHRDDTVDPDDERAQSFEEVSAKDGGWCVTSGSSYAHESWTTHCFRDGVLASGGHGSCGAACHELEFAVHDGE